MGAAISSAPTTFSEHVFKFLEKVEHRVASNPAEREAVFRLRYDAYRGNGFLKPRLDEKLYDPLYDSGPMAWITMTFVDGELAGTVRVSVGTAENAVLPGLQVFSDILAPRLRARQTIVEFTRLAAKLSLSSARPELPYIIMRPGFIAAQHFDADFAVATPREEHIAFYKRAFGAALWCAPRDYPGLTAKLACMGANYPAVRSAIEARYPFYKSTAAERAALFGPRDAAPDGRSPPARVLRLTSSGAEVSSPA
ncbi:MAG: hypothetical protein JO223_24620 [Hyphomicrobiales bacterium]|nr:hypothetical protein [Hyphomicrobiales bacterium]